MGWSQLNMFPPKLYGFTKKIHQGRNQNFSQEGAPIPRGGGTGPIFSEKPYEIEEILVRMGVHDSGPMSTVEGS